MSSSAWCVNCGAQTPELYRRYSESVLKLVKCPKCGNIADKYVEYEPVIVLIDLVLLSKEATRHILLNGDFNSHWKLAILISLIDAYCTHTFGRPPHPQQRHVTMRLTETFDLLVDTDNCYFLSYIHTLLSSVVYILVVLLLSVIVVPRRLKTVRPPPMLIWKSIVLAGSSIFLMIPALICGNPQLYWGLVFVYWFIAQVYVHHVASGTSRLTAALIILAAVLSKRYVLVAPWLTPTCLDD